MKFLYLVVAILLTFVDSNVAQSQKPNVILIMADDMGYECLAVNGSTEYQTPHLDKMAEQGIRFTNCFSQPLCTPSRVKLMTGLYNFRNYEHFGYLNPNQHTFGHIMKDAGYATCIVGKWQLNGINHNLEGNQDTSRPYHFGFDEYALWQLTKGKNQGERFANPLIEQNGKILERNGDAYGPDIFCNYALDFMERNKNKPFFLYYPMVLVHDPFVPTPDSKSWKNKELRYKEDTAYFADMMAYTDKIVGRILDKLRELNLDENTLVIFTADNGINPRIYTNTTNGVVRGAKGSTLDHGNHVPLIMRWPSQIKKPLVYDGLIEFSDFYPSLAELAGVRVNSDGKSFVNLLTGKKYDKRETVFVHYEPRWGKFPSARYVRDYNYKLYSDGRFFNVMEDPLEQNDLSKPKNTSRELKAKEKLQKELDKMPKWLSQVE